jgi:Phage tail tube protein, GTA-gp10
VDTSIELEFGEGRYLFALPWPQIFELERGCGHIEADGSKRGKSIFQIYDETSAGLALSLDEKPVFVGGGRANAKDIREVIRLGLIGGGTGNVAGEAQVVSPIDATRIVESYCYPARPLAESLGVAWAVLRAVIEGVELKKKAEPKAAKAAVKRKSKAVQNPSEKAPS